MTPLKSHETCTCRVEHAFDPAGKCTCKICYCPAHAAAPELLAYVEESLRVLEEHRPGLYGIQVPMIDDLIGHFRAAIARARGQAE